MLLHLSLVTELDRSPPSLATHDGRGGEECSKSRQAERDEESQGSEGQESSQESSGPASVVLVLALTLLVNIDRSSSSTSATASTACRPEESYPDYQPHYQPAKTYRNCRKELRNHCSHLHPHWGLRSHC